MTPGGIQHQYICGLVMALLSSIGPEPLECFQGMTLGFLNTCPPGKLHQNCTCLHNWLTCPPLDKVYIILNIMCLGQKMSLPTRQVANKIYLPGWMFNLPRATGQPLMLHPGFMLSRACVFCIAIAVKVAPAMIFIQLPSLRLKKEICLIEGVFG